MPHTNQRKQQSTQLVDRLISISMFLQKIGNRKISQFGLTQSQFAVLAEIIRKNGVSQKEIVGELLLEKSNLSKIIRKLEEMNLIAVEVVPSDRRKTVVRPTPEGTQLWQKCKAALDELKQILTQGMSDEHFRELATGIDRLSAVITEFLQQRDEGDV